MPPHPLRTGRLDESITARASRPEALGPDRGLSTGRLIDVVSVSEIAVFAIAAPVVPCGDA
jgi:hypothetical protein